LPARKILRYFQYFFTTQYQSKDGKEGKVFDGLVANAGTAGAGWIHETALADW